MSVFARVICEQTVKQVTLHFVLGKLCAVG